MVIPLWGHSVSTPTVEARNPHTLLSDHHANFMGEGCGDACVSTREGMLCYIHFTGEGCGDACVSTREGMLCYIHFTGEGCGDACVSTR